jgi:hypothetical protein
MSDQVGPPTAGDPHGLRGSAIAVLFERSHEMPGAVDHAGRVRRMFMQHGYARIVEALRSDDAFGQPRIPFDEGTERRPCVTTTTSEGDDCITRIFSCAWIRRRSNRRSRDERAHLR